MTTRVPAKREPDSSNDVPDRQPHPFDYDWSEEELLRYGTNLGDIMQELLHKRRLTYLDVTAVLMYWHYSQRWFRKDIDSRVP